jgi:hypothetical protein
MRGAIRDAVNRKSRKPFKWGGLQGYQQLDAISQALGEVAYDEPETGYLERLKQKVDNVVEKYRDDAYDLEEALTWLQQVADCLHYPPSDAPPDPSVTSDTVKQEMGNLLQSFQPDPTQQPAQAALQRVWQRAWNRYGADLLHCYDVPGLPPDNLMLESCFGRLRRHQRRISGRKSTRELRDFGQYQVLFLAENEDELLEQIRQTPPDTYHENRKRLAEAEAPRQLLHRLHCNPTHAMRDLVQQHATRRAELAASLDKPPPLAEPAGTCRGSTIRPGRSVILESLSDLSPPTHYANGPPAG